MTERPQIKPWDAIAFAVRIDDHYDRLQFLIDCQEQDMISIKDDWPDFVAFCAKADEARV